MLESLHGHVGGLAFVLAENVHRKVELLQLGHLYCNQLYSSIADVVLGFGKETRYVCRGVRLATVRCWPHPRAIFGTVWHLAESTS